MLISGRRVVAGDASLTGKSFQTSGASYVFGNVVTCKSTHRPRPLWYFQGSSGAPQTFTPCIYATSGGSPVGQALLAVGPAYTIADSQPAGWVDLGEMPMRAVAGVQYLNGLLSGDYDNFAGGWDDPTIGTNWYAQNPDKVTPASVWPTLNAGNETAQWASYWYGTASSPIPTIPSLIRAGTR